MIRLIACGLALLALTLLGALLHVPGADTIGSPQLKEIFTAALLLAVAIYAAATTLILHRKIPAGAIWFILAIALAARSGPLLTPAFLSSDIYRYVWDGRVQAAGINPYLHFPADPALTALRDDAIFPYINRADTAPTIYAPTAQLVFAAIGRIASTPLAVKIAMLGFETLAVLCLLGLLRRARLPDARILIYAWNPLAIWEFAGNGHVDAVAIGFIAASLLLHALRRNAWTGVCLGAAIAVKFLPAVIAPALWRARTGWHIALAAAVTVIGLYGVYSGAGAKIFGFLSGYGSEEGLSDGSGIWLLALLGAIAPLPKLAGSIYLALAAMLLATLGARIAFRPHPPAGSSTDIIRVCTDAAILMACLTAAISPHYAWYFPWLAIPSVIAPIPAVIWLSAAPALLYLDGLDSRVVLPALIYLPAALLALRGLTRRPRPLALEGTA